MSIVLNEPGVVGVSGTPMSTATTKPLSREWLRNQRRGPALGEKPVVQPTGVEETASAKSSKPVEPDGRDDVYTPRAVEANDPYDWIREAAFHDRVVKAPITVDTETQLPESYWEQRGLGNATPAQRGTYLRTRRRQDEFRERFGVDMDPDMQQRYEGMRTAYVRAESLGDKEDANTEFARLSRHEQDAVATAFKDLYPKTGKTTDSDLAKAWVYRKSQKEIQKSGIGGFNEFNERAMSSVSLLFPEAKLTPMDVRSVYGQADRQMWIRYFKNQVADRPDTAGIESVMTQTGASIASTLARVVGQSEYADTINRMSDAVGAVIRENDDVNPDWVPKWLKRGVRSSLTSLPQSVVAGAIGGPTAMIGWFALSEANSAYTEAKDAGFTKPAALRFAALQGVIEAVPAMVFQKIGLGGLEKVLGTRAGLGAAMGIGETLKQLGIQSLSEIAEEEITEFGHAIYSALEGQEDLTWEKARDIAIETGVSTGISMGLSSGRSLSTGVQNTVAENTYQKILDRGDLTPSRQEAIRLGMTEASTGTTRKQRKEWFEGYQFERRVNDAIADVDLLKDAYVTVDRKEKSVRVSGRRGLETNIVFDADDKISLAYRIRNGIRQAEEAGETGSGEKKVDETTSPTAVKGLYVHFRESSNPELERQLEAAGIRRGTIYIGKDAKPTTLTHELVHWLAEQGVVTKQELKENGNRKGYSLWEGFAHNYAEAAASGELKQGVFKRVFTFMQKLLGQYKPTATDKLRDLRLEKRIPKAVQKFAAKVSQETLSAESSVSESAADDDIDWSGIDEILDSKTVKSGFEKAKSQFTEAKARKEKASEIDESDIDWSGIDKILDDAKERDDGGVDWSGIDKILDEGIARQQELPIDSEVGRRTQEAAKRIKQAKAERVRGTPEEQLRLAQQVEARVAELRAEASAEAEKRRLDKIAAKLKAANEKQAKRIAEAAEKKQKKAEEKQQQRLRELEEAQAELDAYLVEKGYPAENESPPLLRNIARGKIGDMARLNAMMKRDKFKERKRDEKYKALVKARNVARGKLTAAQSSREAQERRSKNLPVVSKYDSRMAAQDRAIELGLDPWTMVDAADQAYNEILENETNYLWEIKRIALENLRKRGLSDKEIKKRLSEGDSDSMKLDKLAKELGNAFSADQGYSDAAADSGRGGLFGDNAAQALQDLILDDSVGPLKMSDERVLKRAEELTRESMEWQESDKKRKEQAEAKRRADEKAEADAEFEARYGKKKPSDDGDKPDSSIEDENITSTKAVVRDDILRARRGELPVEGLEREEVEDWLNDASRRMNRDPNWIQNLILQLIQSPRVISAVEHVGLQLQYRSLHNAMRQTAAILERSTDTAEIASANAASDAILLQIRQLEEAAKNAGTMWGRAGKAQQLVLRADYSVTQMLSRMTTAKRGSLTAEEKATEMEAASKIVKYEKRIADLESQLIESLAAGQLEDEGLFRVVTEVIDGQVQTIIEEVESTAAAKSAATGTKKQRKGVVNRAIDNAWAAFQKAIGVDDGISFEAEPADIDAARPVVKAFVDSGVRTYAELIASVQAKFGRPNETVREALRGAWNSLRATNEIPAPKVDIENDQSVMRFAQKIERSVIEAGLRDWKEVLDAVHEELKQIMPDWTKLKSARAMSGYGLFRELPKDEVSKVKRDINGQIQLRLQKRALLNGEPPKRTGFEGREVTEEQRKLQKEVNELKKTVPFKTSERSLKSALDAAKTFARNRIADLKREIKSRVKVIPKRTLTVPDAELKALREELAEVRKFHAAIFPKAPMTDKQRIAAAEKANDRLIARLEDDIKRKNLRSRDKLSPATSDRINTQKARLAELRAIKEKLRATDPEYQREKAKRENEAYIKFLNKKLSDLNKKGYGLEPKKEPKPRPDSPEIRELKYKVAMVKEAADRREAAMRRKSRSRMAKVLSVIPEGANLIRALKTSFEWSHFLRQGGALVASHPIIAAKTIPRLFRVMLPKESWQAIRKGDFKGAIKWADLGRFEIAEELRHRPNAVSGLYDQAKLSLTKSEGAWTQQEEYFQGEIAKYIPGVAASERVFVMGLNLLRANVFDALVDKALVRSGNKGGVIPIEQAKLLANFVNVASGRGSLGLGFNNTFDAAAHVASIVMFAPRFVASRFQLATGQPMWKALHQGDTVAARIMAEEYIKTAGSLAMFYTICLLAGAFEDDDELKPKISFDPRSSDFGKVVTGNQRLDPLFGVSQSIVFMSRMLTRETKNLKGEVRPLTGPKVRYGQPTLGDTAGRFFRSKLAPAPGLAWDLWSKETYMGERTTAGHVARNLVSPLGWQDIFEASFRGAGFPRNVVDGLLAFLGMGVQVYDNDKKTRKQKLNQPFWSW